MCELPNDPSCVERPHSLSDSSQEIVKKTFPLGFSMILVISVIYFSHLLDECKLQSFVILVMCHFKSTKAVTLRLFTMTPFRPC